MLRRARRSQCPNWEAEPTTGAACYGGAGDCAAGSVPPLAVAASQPSDVAAALRFAAAYHIRLVVKSTGHDFQARGSVASAMPAARRCPQYRKVPS